MALVATVPGVFAQWSGLPGLSAQIAPIIAPLEPLHDAVALPLAEYETPFIAAAVCPAQASLAGSQVVVPVALVNAAVRELHSAETMSESIFEAALVASAIFVFDRPYSAQLPASPHSLHLVLAPQHHAATTFDFVAQE